VERHGACDHYKKRITVSGALTDLNDAAWFRELLLHEIAHALASWGAAHGPEWKAVCRRIGAKPQACGDTPPFEPPPKYILTCPGCGMTDHSHRLHKGSYCIACGPEKGLLLVALNPDFKEPVRSPRVA
jgi:predicted SprT family Zn-dependent metalloprotease